MLFPRPYYFHPSGFEPSGGGETETERVYEAQRVA